HLCCFVWSPPPPRSTLFPTRRSSDLAVHGIRGAAVRGWRRLALRAAVGRLEGNELFHRPAAIQRRERPCRCAATGSRKGGEVDLDRKSTRLNSSHVKISYAVFCLKKK